MNSWLQFLSPSECAMNAKRTAVLLCKEKTYEQVSVCQEVICVIYLQPSHVLSCSQIEKELCIDDPRCYLSRSVTLIIKINFAT